MRYVAPSEIDGEVQAQGSKSAMIRAVIGGVLANGDTIIRNPSRCDDALMALSLIKELGAEVVDEISVVGIAGGKLDPQWYEFDCGESGLLMRIMAPICCLMEHEFTLVGQGTLLNRPMDMMELPLRELGAFCETNDGFAPIKVKGKMTGGEIWIDGSTTSQVLTGLLMALPLCEQDSIVNVTNLQSRPYVELSTKVLKRFGIKMEADLEEGIVYIPGEQEYQAVEITMPGDWSGAAFLLVAGAIAGKATVKGLSTRSSQADRDILNVLKMAGAKVDVVGNSITVQRNGELKGFEFDATQCPDLFPPLTVLALNCEGESKIFGVDRLSVKESNRGYVLVDELSKIGGDLAIEDEHLVIRGSRLEGGKGDPYGDHRIAMALAIAALTSADGIQIIDDDCVTKSYPNFFKDLESLMVV